MEAIVKNIIENPRVAEKFFYVDMAPKMASIASGYCKKFNVAITKADVSTITYASCWENDWARLRVFEGRTSIHRWVAKIASQETFKFVTGELLACQGSRDDSLDDMIDAGRKVNVSAFYDTIVDDEMNENRHLLRELLMYAYKNIDWQDNALEFIDAILLNLGWNEIQKDVWRERFLHKTPSKILAKRYNVRHSWIDNTYSKLNRQFRETVSSWWNSMNV